MNNCPRLGRNFALIAMGMAVGVVLGSLIQPVTGATPVDTLNISTCRVDQSLFRVQVTQQGSGSIVSGDANVRGNTAVVAIVAVDNLGRSKQIQGNIGGGYVGVGFRAAVPIEKGLLRNVTVCFP
ncbi:MAG: hypothetical protein ACRDGN_12950 [bacterium]